MNRRTNSKHINKRRAKTGTKPVRSNIYIACEGAKTETQYINLLKQRFSLENTNINPISRKTTKSSPTQVLKDIKNETKGRFVSGDQAWIIIDKDSWTKEQLNEVLKWVREKEDDRKLFISSPSFDLWILLHYTEHKGTITQKTCIDKLKNYVPNYNKKLPKQFTDQEIKQAQERAKKLTENKNLINTSDSGTEMYKVIEILEEKSE